MAEHAYEVLRDRLVLLDIAPGQPIHEAQLAEDLGVGRTPIREALKRLETDHLVVSYARRGTFATPVEFRELGHISEIRQLLEPLAARAAAGNADPHIREQLLEKLDVINHLDPAVKQRDLLLLDVHMHRLIYQASGNMHLEETLVRLDSLVTRIWCLAIDQMADVARHIMEHAGLLRAILDGDADTAAELASHHVLHFEKALRSAL